MSAYVTQIHDKNFNQQVLQQAKPVLVDFWAPWCGPCKAMGPVFESLAEMYSEHMVFAKCNVDESQATAVRLGIKSIPTLLFFNGGERVHAIAGMVPFGTLEEAIKKVLAEKTMSAPFLVS